jgi:hypothetical protein
MDMPINSNRNNPIETVNNVIKTVKEIGLKKFLVIVFFFIIIFVFVFEVR